MAGQGSSFLHGIPARGLSHRSEKRSADSGVEPQGVTDRGRNEFLTRVHPEDSRAASPRRSRASSPERPSYSGFPFVTSDRTGQEVWLEETGKAEFDGDGRYLLKGLTWDVTEHTRAEERQRLLIRELDHRKERTGFCRHGCAAHPGGQWLDGRVPKCLMAAFNRWPMRRHCSAAATGRA